MKLRIAIAAAATFTLAACGSSEDASTEAEVDTVEMAADEALVGVEEEPVEDPAATAPVADSAAEVEERAAAEAASVQEAGDNAAATAEAAMDAMAEDMEE